MVEGGVKGEKIVSGGASKLDRYLIMVYLNQVIGVSFFHQY